MSKLKWGIFGTGSITNNFSKILTDMHEEAELAAVASRNIDTAKAFAEKYNIPKTFGSYEELAQSSDVDIIYIATPHTFHYENMLLCLNNGKHVLCEKPFTVTAQQAKEVFSLAKKKNLFVMEAFWTKFFPLFRKLEKVLADGVIGDISVVTAQYGFTPPAEQRLARKMDPALAGGALLDVGVYTIGFASMICGYAPEAIESFAVLGDKGTDTYSTTLMRYKCGAMVYVSSAIGTVMPLDGWIYGTKGRIHIPNFNCPLHFEVTPDDAEAFICEMKPELTGFEYQIREAQNCIGKGKIQSDIMTPEQSIAVMYIMDRIRSIWGMKFPFEK